MTVSRLAAGLMVLVVASGGVSFGQTLPAGLKQPAGAVAEALEPWSSIAAGAAARLADGPLRPVASSGSQRVSTADTVVGNSKTVYADPEIWQDQAYLVWQDATNDQVWVATINRQTGGLIPADGRGIAIAKVAPYQLLWSYFLTGSNPKGSLNGPEWGNSQDGLALYFTITDNKGVLRGGRYRFSTREVEQVTSGGTLPQRCFLPSTDSTDSRVRLLYFQGPINSKTQTALWKYEDSTITKRVPLSSSGTSGLRWIPGREACTTNVNDADDVLQVGEYNLQTDQVTLLTNGPEAHYDAYSLPEEGTTNPAWLACVEDRVRVAIYRFEAGGWVKHTVIAPPVENQPRAQVFGVKPFYHQGRPMVTYTVSKALPYLTNSVICLADFNGEINQVVSNTTNLVRADPEAFSGNSSLFIYYYLLRNPVGQLRRIKIDIEP